MDDLIKILTEHSKNDFQEFYDIGYKAEGKFGCCGQCVTVPFIEILGVDNNIFKYAAGFCAGIGMKANYPCGAYSGGVMLLSSFFGRLYQDLPGDIEAGKNKYRYTCSLVRKFEDKFKKEFGDTLCSNIHLKIFGRTFDLLDSNDYPVFEQMGAHRDKCTNVVGSAARMVAQVLFEEIGANA